MTSTIPKPVPSETTTVTSPSGEPAKIQEFKLNHPKNYLAVPLAVVADGATDALIREHAVNLPRRARRGAEETGLIAATGDVTPLGEAVSQPAVSTEARERPCTPSRTCTVLRKDSLTCTRNGRR